MVSTHLKNISQNGNLPQVRVKTKNIWNHHLQKVLDSAAAGGCSSIESVKQVTRISDLKRVQSVVTVATQMWLRMWTVYKSTALLIKTSKTMELSRVSSVYDNDFIPSSYHPKFLIIGLKNGCKTPGMVAFFSPLEMPGHNSQANPGMPGRSSVVSGAFTARESRTDFWRFCTWCFWGCFGMPSWFLMPS